MTNTPITDHWWSGFSYRREEGRLVALNGLSALTGIDKNSLSKLVNEYEQAWTDWQENGSKPSELVLRRMWVYKDEPDEPWVRVWEAEEVGRWMHEMDKSGKLKPLQNPSE